MVLLLAIVLIAAAILWLPKPTVELPPTLAVTVPVAPTLAFQGGTAVLAFTSATNVAREWQSDAQLIEAKATWPQGVTRSDILTGTTVWSFIFYSPGQSSVANIEVLENVAQLISQNPAPNPLTPASSTGWRIDSPEAVQILLEQAGGDQFLRTQGVSILNMNLSAVTESGRMEWTISLFSSQTGQSLTIRLDANSGEIMPLTSS